MLEVSRISGSHEIQDLRLKGLYEYWDSKRLNRRAPACVEIDPTEIPDLLGYLNLFEVREDLRDFKVRLNGSAVADMLGQDVTGRWCSEVMSGEDAERCKAAFILCVEEQTPVLAETTLAFCGKPHAGQTLVALPLSEDGSRVDMIITAHAYHVAGISLGAVAIW